MSSDGEPKAPAGAAPEAVPGWRDPSLRKVVAHYHLFKNAGTSVDDALKGVFGDRWTNIEAKRGHHLPAEDFTEHIRTHHRPVVFSSHNAALPVPVIEGAAVLPVIFLRHPLDRVSSIYRFERKQFPVRTKGAVMAKLFSLKRYVRWRLGYDDLLSGFQLGRLSAGSDRPGTLEGAQEVLRSLPFVGVVEHYGASLMGLQELLRQAFPWASLEVSHSNRSSGRAKSLETRLRATREELGAELYEELVARNQGDLALHAEASERWTSERWLSPGRATEGS